MIASVCVHVCAGNKLPRLLVVKSRSSLEGASLYTKPEVVRRKAGKRGKRDAGTFRVSASIRVALSSRRTV